MKPLQNVLYITTPGAYLSKERETIKLKMDGRADVKIPIHGIQSIVCFGSVGMSPWLMGFCAQRNVTVTFLTETGRFLARVLGPVHGNVLLRRAQYRIADEEKKAAAIAAHFVIGKLSNARQVLIRCIRDHGETPALRQAEKIHGERIRLLTRQESRETLRGMEGEAAKQYFAAFSQLIRKEHPLFLFRNRNRRPPTDAVNALLSFFYTLLVHDVRSALETVGLDSAVGFLHKDRPGRPGLALDLMEELRPFFCDRLAVSLINREQVRPEDFQKRYGNRCCAAGRRGAQTGSCRMAEDETRTHPPPFYRRKNSQRSHPFSAGPAPGPASSGRSGWLPPVSLEVKHDGTGHL